MDPNAQSGPGFTMEDLLVEAIRMAVNIAQSECVCQLHLSVCLLTDTGVRAGLQPFLYETVLAA